MEKDPSQNQRNLRRLLMSVQASYCRLNLLIAICDNWKYRDELIGSYEKELTAKGTSCHRVRIDRQQPSLKQCLQDLVSQEPELMTVEKPAIITVLGADELLGIRLNEPKSAQEQFFFSAQWTREGLRDFKFPIVIWLTPDIATSLAQQAPDFWSWRGGTFEFSQSISASIQVLPTTYELTNQVESTQNTFVKTDPTDLQKQIDELLSQDPESPLLASLYNSLGDAYKENIQYNQAELAYSKALDLYEQLEADHPEVATSLDNLAGLYYSQGKYGYSESLFLQSLEIRERQLGQKHPDVATSLNNLAGLYRAQGKYNKAEILFLRSLDIRESQLDTDHLDVATICNNLASLYRAQGKYSEAEILFLRSLEIMKHQLGTNHPDVATSLNNLAGLYKSQGKYSKAESLYVQSLEIWERQLGVNHPSVATSLNNLANLYEFQENYSEAEPLYRRSLEICEHQLGRDHPDIATSLNNLATLYHSQGKYSEVEPLHLRSLSIRERQLGTDHPNVAQSLMNLAALYHNTQRHLEALQSIQRAIKIYKQKLGIDHPETQKALGWLQVIKGKGKKEKKDKRGFGFPIR